MAKSLLEEKSIFVFTDCYDHGSYYHPDLVIATGWLDALTLFFDKSNLKIITSAGEKKFLRYSIEHRKGGSFLTLFYEDNFVMMYKVYRYDAEESKKFFSQEESLP